MKAPETTSLIVVVLLTASVVFPVRRKVAGVVSPVPSKVRLPLPVLPSVMFPLVDMELASVMADPLSSKAPPERVKVPIPNGPLVIVVPLTVLLPATRVPELNKVAPV